MRVFHTHAALSWAGWCSSWAAGAKSVIFFSCWL